MPSMTVSLIRLAILQGMAFLISYAVINRRRPSESLPRYSTKNRGSGSSSLRSFFVILLCLGRPAVAVTSTSTEIDPGATQTITVSYNLPDATVTTDSTTTVYAATTQTTVCYPAYDLTTTTISSGIYTSITATSYSSSTSSSSAVVSPTPGARRREISPMLDTNAKRMKAGLPPLPQRKLGWSSKHGALHGRVDPDPDTTTVTTTTDPGLTSTITQSYSYPATTTTTVYTSTVTVDDPGTTTSTSTVQCTSTLTSVQPTATHGAIKVCQAGDICCEDNISSGSCCNEFVIVDTYPNKRSLGGSTGLGSAGSERVSGMTPRGLRWSGEVLSPVDAAAFFFSSHGSFVHSNGTAVHDPIYARRTRQMHQLRQRRGWAKRMTENIVSWTVQNRFVMKAVTPIFMKLVTAPDQLITMSPQHAIRTDDLLEIAEIMRASPNWTSVDVHSVPIPRSWLDTFHEGLVDVKRKREL